MYKIVSSHTRRVQLAEYVHGGSPSKLGTPCQVPTISNLNVRIGE